MQRRIECRVSGRVQGVFFRDFVRGEAKARGVTGYARNESDGSVLIAAEGEEKELKSFLEAIHAPRPPASVDSAEVAWKEAEGEWSDFKI